jgi:hypothetical protein
MSGVYDLNYLDDRLVQVGSGHLRAGLRSGPTAIATDPSHSLFGALVRPQQMPRREQAKELMTNAIARLKISVQPGEPVFTDYQASILLAYYLGRDHPPTAFRECGGVNEVQYSAYHFAVLGAWSATATQLRTGIDGWRKGCTPGTDNSFWVFDAGWGLNLLDELSQSAPNSISRARRFGETISLFKIYP